MRIIKAGAASQTIYVEILDSASTTGGRKTGIAYNTAGLTAYYVRTGGSATAITLATLVAANSAYSSGGFKEVDATNMPGIYRLDVPDAAVAAGVPNVVVTLKGATGMVQVSVDIQLVAVDPQDSVRLGMTALPNAAAEAAGGLYTRGTGAGQINQPANGMVDINVVRYGGTAGTFSAGRPEVNTTHAAGTAWGSGAITAASIAASALNGKGDWNIGKTGYSLSSAGIQAIWDALTSALTTVGSIGKLLVDNINATISSRLASVSYTAPLDAAGTRAAVGLASANLDTQLSGINSKTTNLPAAPAAVGDIPTAVQNADALLGRNVSGGSSTGRTVKQALHVLRNKSQVAAGTLTVYDTDDTTSSWTAAVTTTAGDPISQIDPA